MCKNIVSDVTNAFSRWTAPLVKTVERAVTPPDNGMSAALASQTAAMQTANDIALKSAKDANTLATAASLPPQDSESAKRAAEDRMRRLISSSGFTQGAQTFGGAPIGFRMLSGQ